MFEIWTKDKNGKDALLITDVPSRTLAEKIESAVRETYDDHYAHVEQL